MEREALVTKIMRRAGLSAAAEAEAAVHAVLVALGESLSRTAVRHIGDELAPWLRGSLVEGSKRTPGSFVREVASVEQVPLGFALEHAGVILRALDAELSPEARRYLRREAPAEARALLDGLEDDRPPAEPAPHGARRSLAAGRPGSRHPVSESAPPRAHTHSVASTDAPHGDSVVSLGRPPLQEAGERSLAAGRPGSETPIVDIHEEKVLPARSKTD